jgi:inner membrane transporter RhtA
MRPVRLPPHAYFVGSAVFHYLGPAFAVLLFARVDVLGVAWLRIAAAAAVFALWRRPWRLLSRLDERTRSTFVAWGAVLAVMNVCFYLAIDRLPLGTVAAIEFLPVIALAALGTRTWRNAAALVLAVGGVYLLTDVSLDGEPLGVALALANAVLFAAYVVLGHRVAQGGQVSGIDGLAASMLVALVVVTPLGGWEALPALTDPVALAAGIGVGIASSVIPYVCDQLAMARLERASYALLVSLLPATATAVGLLVLGQVPSRVELVGIALVVGGVASHRERSHQLPELTRQPEPSRIACDSAAIRARQSGPTRVHRSVAEVPAPREHHRGADALDRFDHVEVALRAAGLDEGVHALLERQPGSVGEGEERVRRQ